MAEVLEVEAEPVDADVLPDGVKPEKASIPLFEFLDAGNLVDKADKIPGGKQGISSLTIQLLDEAERTMKPWLDKYNNALKLAKLEAEAEHKTFPFKGASIVMMPFILEAMLDFHSRTVPEMVWAKNVVAFKTYGAESKEKTARADRASTYMNYQVSETIEYWRPEQDKLMLALPCVGTGYKRSYFNGDDQEVSSDLHTADEVIFNHDYRTFDEAPDKFMREEMTRNEVITMIRGASEWDLAENVLPLQKDHPKPFKFIRAYTWIDLDGDGLTEPYEVVIYDEDKAVVSIQPAYDEDEIITNEDGEIVDVKMSRTFTQYRFLPDPEGGPMGMGWGVLLSDLFDSINTIVRQGIDAGTLASLAANSGLIDSSMSGGSGRGNRQQSGPIEVRMGELTPITTGGKPLAQSVVQFPFRGPDATLFQIMSFMVEQVRTMTNSALNMDTNSQEAAMMYLARLQQGLKVPNSIVMRVYNCAKEEFTKIALLNFKHYSNPKYNRVLDEQQEADMQADFNPEDCDIDLAVDPSQGSDIERQQRASVVLEEAKIDQSNILNKRQAMLDWLEALKTPNIEALAPEPDPNAKDPMQELLMANMAREAELAERDMNIREAKLELERTREMLKAMREGAEYGLTFDQTESEITLRYAQAFKALWEIGMAGDDPVQTVKDIEGRLIDKQQGLPAPPIPLDSPEPNPQPQGADAGGPITQ